MQLNLKSFVVYRKSMVTAIFQFLVVFSCLSLFTVDSNAQFVNPDTASIVDPSSTVYPNNAAGEFTPGKGFLLVKNPFASLNISLYAMARWVNQMPAEDTWLDHSDSLRTFDGRNDIYWHRTMIWFTGYLGTPKLTYMATVWTVTTTQQTLVYGNINYQFSKRLTAGIGIAPNACIRTLQGPFPLFSSTDRTMANARIRIGHTPSRARCRTMMVSRPNTTISKFPVAPISLGNWSCRNSLRKLTAVAPNTAPQTAAAPPSTAMNRYSVKDLYSPGI